jgi:hypothetical protein
MDRAGDVEFAGIANLNQFAHPAGPLPYLKRSWNYFSPTCPTATQIVLRMIFRIEPQK